MNASNKIQNANSHVQDDNKAKDDSLPGYQFIRELGHGTQGQVFLANSKRSQKLVAIKRLNIHSVKTWKSYELFHREADVLKSLRVDGVAQFYDAIDRLEDNPPCSYIIQEYIKGESLKQMLDKGHRFHIDDVYDILIQTPGLPHLLFSLK